MPKAPEMPNVAEMFDVRKYMGEYDPKKMMNELQNMMKQFKMPGVDIDALMAAQQKNIEALTNANKIAFEGLQAMARRQAEVLQESMSEAAKAVDALSKAGSPPEIAAKQAEMVKGAFEKSIATMREMAEIATKSSTEASNTINARIASSLEEMRSMALKMKP